MKKSLSLMFLPSAACFSKPPYGAAQPSCLGDQQWWRHLQNCLHLAQISVSQGLQFKTVFDPDALTNKQISNHPN